MLSHISFKPFSPKIRPLSWIWIIFYPANSLNKDSYRLFVTPPPFFNPWLYYLYMNSFPPSWNGITCKKAWPKINLPFVFFSRMNGVSYNSYCNVYKKDKSLFFHFPLRVTKNLWIKSAFLRLLFLAFSNVAIILMLYFFAISTLVLKKNVLQTKNVTFDWRNIWQHFKIYQIYSKLHLKALQE